MNEFMMIMSIAFAAYVQIDVCPFSLLTFGDKLQIPPELAV